MAKRGEPIKFKNFIEINGAEPIPVESLSQEQIEEAMLHMQDACMHVLGYRRCEKIRTEMA